MNTRIVAVACGVLQVWASAALAQIRVPTPGWDVRAKTISPPVIVGGSICSSADGKWKLGLSGGLPTPPNGNGAGVYTVCERKYSVTPGNPGISQWLVANCVDYPIAPAANGVTMVDFAGPQGWEIYAKQTLTDYANPWTPVVSPWSAPFVPNLAPPPQPDFPEVPLWECGWATLVGAHQPGDQLNLVSAQVGTRFHVPSAFGNTDYMPAGYTQFSAGEMLYAEVLTCEGYSGNKSTPQIVASYPGSSLNEPRVQVASVTEGGTTFVANQVVNGATLIARVERNGNSVAWTEHCGGPLCVAFVPGSIAALASGDQIYVSQELCPGSISKETNVGVKDCDDSAPPVTDPSPQVGDSMIHLSVYPRMVTIGVFATSDTDPTVGLRRIGVAFDTGEIPLTEPIANTDKWVIVSVFGSCTPQYSDGYYVGRK